MKKRFLAIIVLIIFIFTGCGKQIEEQNLVSIKYFSDDSYLIQEKHLIDINIMWEREPQKLDNIFQNSINTLCKDVLEFLNTEFDLNWKTLPIEAYFSNVQSSISGSLVYGACYYNGKIYIDELLVNEGIDSIRLNYVVAHELLHYLYDINSRVTKFAIQKEDLYVGGFLEEAFVDSLARRYIIAKYPNLSTNDITSGYKYIRLNIDLLELAIPDIFQYFFNIPLTNTIL